MIDITTGQVRLDDGVVLQARMSETALRCEANRRSHSVECNVQHDEYSVLALRSATIDGRAVILRLTFEGGALSAIDIVEKLSTDLGWNGWSEAQELWRRERHDEWLHSELGPPPYEFSWGRIVSSYDARTAASAITVRYECAAGTIGPGS